MADTITAAKAPPGALYEMADAFQGDLDAGVTAANDQVLAAWSQTYAQVRADYDALLGKIAQAKASGQPMSPAWLYQQERLKNALATTKAEVHTFAQQASHATVQAHQAAVGAAAKAHAQMGAQALQEAGIEGSFVRLNPDNLKHLVGFLHDGSPVDALFTGLAAETAGAAREALVRGLTLGKGVDWISRRLDQALDIPRWRAETIVRTESQRVYRSVARQTYMANADVLEGWVWKAHLDSRTCPACMAMDGKVMPVGSTLDGHPRCRCAMVPRTKSWDDLGLPGIEDSRPPIRDGQAWFKAQPASVQRAMLGPRKWHAWKDGQITLDDLVARHSDDTWGTMRRERSMREIEAGHGANWDDEIETPAPAPAKRPQADPEAVANISATHTLEEIEATLQSMPLTEQGRLNMLAAHQVKVSELPKGPVFRMPEPDPVWANKATEKMNAAVLSKGYPSKGYSQTVAVYKAKANGVVGQKVGVVKSLSWQEKVNAQKALADHDAWLQQHLAKKLASKGEGKGIIQALNTDLGNATSHPDAVMFFHDAKTAAGFMLDEAEKARTLALVDAKEAKYLDDVAEALGHRQASPEWVHEKGTHLVIHEDGWGTYTYQGASGPMPPGKVAEALGGKGWGLPKVEPDPEGVQAVVAMLKGKDGYLDNDFAAMIQEATEKGLVKDAQQAANNLEAIKIAQATLPWKPEPEYVAKILQGIKDHKSPATYVDDLIKHADGPDVKPLSKANIHAAVDQWKHDVAEAAKVKAPPAKVKVATAEPKAPGFGTPPKPSDLKSTGQVLGTHGARVYEDAQGNRWLFKPPKDSGDAFLTTLDEAASRLQARTGLKAPDTYVMTLDGRRGSLQRMFDATDAFPYGLKPDTLSEADLLAVQREHVLDWLLSNHDGHHQQFLRMPDGSLVGIDKGQAFRWMGQDRLDWDFHPNASYGAPEPVYNTLYREFAKGGKGEVLDPRHGPLADYIKSVQGIDDDELRAMFRPYAEEAAARGKLAVRQTQPGLKAPAIPANDVDAFLDAIVARKHALADDFSTLYDKAAKARSQALPDWKPAKPKAAKPVTGKAKWKDRPAPVKPEPPLKPEAEVAKDFGGWESKVKAKYEAYAPGKKLENSNNWARVRRVIDERDRQAVQELLDRHYLDDALAKEALDLIDKAEAKVKRLEAAHAKAMAAYERKTARWKKDMADWRDANGIKGGETKGLDAGQRHSNHGGDQWGRKHWDAARDWSLSEKKHLQTYSGSDYMSINSTGRRLKDKAQDSSNWGSWKSLVDGIDNAMEKATRMPEDTILVRGTGVDSFVVDGKLLTGSQGHLLPQIVGTVQRDEAYMSSSVGQVPGYGAGQKVQMKILAPAGTKASYIDPISLNQGEREMLLPRSTSLYIHAAYEQNGRWVVEAEIVERDFVPPLDPNGAPIVSPATERFDWP